MPFAIEPMQAADIPEVAEIEKICFITPWPASAYERELQNSSSTRYTVIKYYKDSESLHSAPSTVTTQNFPPDLISFFKREGENPGALPNSGTVIGYAGLWMMLDEAHVTTLGVHPDYRGSQFGELLLIGLIDLAMQLGASWLTLEVRVSNVVAQNLYKKYYFKEEGVRRKYYSDNNEDAFIMWSEEITKPAFREKYARLKQSLLEKLTQTGKLLASVDPHKPVLEK